MKRILITGANSYIGNSLTNYLSQWPDQYQMDSVDMVDGSWKERSFAGYDTVLHVAGIVHIRVKNPDAEMQALYRRVNTDLALEAAGKAKREGVSQFIFMSTTGVYGSSAPVGKNRVITRETPLTPKTAYAMSKAKAEEGLIPMGSEDFRVVILRPPMIYGRGCKGNYVTLSKLAQKLPVFPYVDNHRSMLYIDNFSEFVRLMVDNREQGIFWPQDAQWVNTSHMAALIAQAHGKKLPLLKGTQWALKAMGHATDLVDKAFGSLCYDLSLSEYKENYRVKNLEDAVNATERD